MFSWDVSTYLTSTASLASTLQLMKLTDSSTTLIFYKCVPWNIFQFLHDSKREFERS